MPLGGAALAGEGAVSQYSPVRRVIVSCRGARASVVSGAAGAGSRAASAARPAGFGRPRGLGAAWRGRGFALGPRDRPQYSPDRRVIVSYVSRVTEGFALGPRRDRPRGPRPPLGRWASAGRGGWVPLGGAEGSPSARGIALSTRRIAGSSYRVEARGPVSCRVPRGAGSRATIAARPVGFRRTRGAGCRLAEWGGGRSPGSLNSERWLGLPTSGAGDDVGSAMPSAREQPRAGMTSPSLTRRLRSAFCMKESIDVAGIGSRSVRPGCPARRGARSVRRWRAGG